MNIMKLTFATLLILSSFVFTSCNDDDDTNNEPGATTADIVGSVNLYDEATTQISDSGMTVEIEGVLPLISAITDFEGDFTLSNVPFGTYTLIYSKTGYGTYKRLDVVHTNTGSPTPLTTAPSLGQSSSTQVTDLSASPDGGEVVLSITTDPAGNSGNTRYVRYFLSASSSVSDENYSFVSEVLISQINPKETSLTVNEFSKAGFSSGQTVYAKAYGDSFWSNEYEDSDLGRTIFPNLNATSAGAVSFVVP